MARSDKIIIKQILSGHVNAYSHLVKKYQDKLISYAQTIIGDYSQAQDIVQISFINAYQNLNSYNPKYKFSSWIYRIVHNQAVNSIPSKPIVSLDFADWIAEILPGKTDLEEEAVTTEIKKLVQMCLNDLPLKYRQVLSLYYLQEIKYKDIGDILKVPTSTVGIRLKRGKILLKNVCLQKGIKP